LGWNKEPDVHYIGFIIQCIIMQNVGLFVSLILCVYIGYCMYKGYYK